MNVKQELIDSAKQIREKYRELKRGKYLEAEERFETFKPLIEPLEELKNIASEKQVLPMIYQSTTSRIPIRSSMTPQKIGRLATEYLGNYLNKSGITDTTYGIRRDGNKFFIGNKEVEIKNEDFSIDDINFKGTKGLWELLTLKEPMNYTPADMDKYKEILELTNGHLKGYKPDAALSSNKHFKYTNIIRPLFKGTGLREVTGNKIDYVYWDDPNELVDRLRLLYLSREAGNTGVFNEINAIIEELRESGIIY